MKYLDCLNLMEFGTQSLHVHQHKVKKHRDDNAKQHNEPLPERPSLESLNAYRGLKALDLRSSDLDNLD